MDALDPKSYLFNGVRESGGTCLMFQTEAAKPATQSYSRSHPQKESGGSQEITQLLPGCPGTLLCPPAW